MKPAQTILVVGGNAAGAAAAAKAKRVNPNAEVFLFEQSSYISTGTCELPYVLSGEIEDYRDIIFYTPQKFLDEKKVKVYTNYRVVEIFPRTKKILVQSINDQKNYELRYDKLILATGSKAKRVPQLPSELTNVVSFKTVDDLIKIKKLVHESRSKKVGIIGSGYIGLEVSESFSKLNFEIYLIEQASLPFPSADNKIQLRVKEILDERKIVFIGNAGKLKFNIAHSQVQSFEHENRKIDVDMIVTCAGFSPNISLAEQAKIEIGKHGGIKVNNKLQTSQQDIYACGDCIEVKNILTRSDEYIPLATFAQQQGHTAGENAALGNIFYQPVVKNISVKIFDNYFTQVGLSEKELLVKNIPFASESAEISNLVKVMKGSRSVFGKILFDRSSKKIYGAAFLGGKEVSGYADLISAYIKNNLPAHQLVDTEYNYTPPLSPFINLLSVLGRKIKFNK